MNELQTESILALLALLERIATALEAAAAPRKKRERATREPKPTAEPIWLQEVRVVALAKDWPNAGGWYKAKLGLTTERSQNWLETKDAEVARLLADAEQSGALVNATFVETRTGKYTNWHIQSLEYAGAALMVDDDNEGDDEKPF